MGESCCCHLFCVSIVGVTLLAAGGGDSEEAAGAHLLGAIVTEPRCRVANARACFTVEVTIVEQGFCEYFKE